MCITSLSRTLFYCWENLLAAIQDVTGLKDDDAVIQTWAKAYEEIADVFIQLEQEVYQNMLWDGFKPFKITNISQNQQT